MMAYAPLDSFTSMREPHQESNGSATPKFSPSLDEIEEKKHFADDIDAANAIFFDENS